MNKILVIILFSFTMSTSAQEKLPYHQIPEYPDEYSATTTLSRMIDGLGYRYYWASEGLRVEDLEFQPSEDARSMKETVEHLYDLSQSILNASQNLPNVKSTSTEDYSYEQLREMTLNNLYQASQHFLKLEEDQLNEYAIIFQREKGKSEFPIWNLINGQIADAIYHTGQVVSFRRTNGNPMNPNVSVFMGKNRE